MLQPRESTSQNMSDNTNSDLLLKITYPELAVLWNFKEPPNTTDQDSKHSPNTSLVTASQCVEEISNKNHHWRCSRHIIFLQFRFPPKYPKAFHTCKLSEAQQSGQFYERPQGCKDLTLPDAMDHLSGHQQGPRLEALVLMIPTIMACFWISTQLPITLISTPIGLWYQLQPLPHSCFGTQWTHILGQTTFFSLYIYVHNIN